MAKCDVCGNEYDKAFQIVTAQGSETFDSFECARPSMRSHPPALIVPCRIIGHGIEARGAFYCCAHCAKASDVSGVGDRA
jgi:hypothetical protein